ncbi:Integrase/recombinase [Fructobacillus cardui]|uniref:Arm DNA-binding domain-containing protein n=1 Tax=Fructobacillus cardui TaxID=2893170 RepID=UPI002D88F9D3|nr:Integrase/recombinase [Fructobacillus cardui]
MASFVKLNQNNWRAFTSITVNGKKKRPSKQGFKTKKEAQLWASSIESGVIELEKNKYKDMLLSDYFESWVETYKSNLESGT